MKRFKILFCFLLVTFTVLVNVDKTYAKLSNVSKYIEADVPFSWNSEDNTELLFDVKQAGINIEDIRGTRIRFSVSDESKGFGGAVAWNGYTCGWIQTEWGNADSGKQVLAENIARQGEYCVTVKTPEQVFFKDDTQQDHWAQIVMTSWWGGSISINQIDLLDAQGNVIYTTGNTSDGSESFAYTQAEKTIVTVLFVMVLLVFIMLKIHLIHKRGGDNTYEHQDKAKAF